MQTSLKYFILFLFLFVNCCYASSNISNASDNSVEIIIKTSIKNVESNFEFNFSINCSNNKILYSNDVIYLFEANQNEGISKNFIICEKDKIKNLYVVTYLDKPEKNIKIKNEKDRTVANIFIIAEHENIFDVFFYKISGEIILNKEYFNYDGKNLYLKSDKVMRIPFFGVLKLFLIFLLVHFLCQKIFFILFRKRNLNPVLFLLVLIFSFILFTTI